MSILVNGQEIPQSAVNFELQRLIRFYRDHNMAEQSITDSMDELRERATEQAIGAKLLMDRTEQLDLQPSDDDVEDRIQGMMDNAGGEQPFLAALAKQNLTLQMIQDGIRKGRRVDLLVEKITEDIADPTESDIRAYFDAHKDEYQTADRAHARHILIKPASDSEDDQRKARAKIADIRKQIDEEDADFAKMAEEHSECPSGKETGGGLGWFSRGMMLPEFDEVVFEMDVDDLSDVVETPLGYHIIHKHGHEGGGAADITEVYDKIKDLLRHTTRGEAVAAYVAELRETADVHIEK